MCLRCFPVLCVPTAQSAASLCYQQIERGLCAEFDEGWPGQV